RNQVGASIRLKEVLGRLRVFEWPLRLGAPAVGAHRVDPDRQLIFDHVTGQPGAQPFEGQAPYRGTEVHGRSTSGAAEVQFSLLCSAGNMIPRTDDEAVSRASAD